MSAIRVKKFDPSTIKESRIIFIIGKRHTGKSVLMKDLLYHMPRPDYVLAMAPTEDTLQMFREFLPESCIFDHFSQEKLERTVTLQRELVNRGKKRTVLILLDDCMYQKGVLKSNAMRSIFFNGRHDHISLMCAAQYMMEVDVSLRTNIDYLFTMRENILTNRQKLFKYYFGQFAKFDEFDKVMTACTQDYRSLVLDGTVSTTTCATDCVMWYRASYNIPSFRLCKPIYWSWSEKYCLTQDAIRRAQRRQYEIETVQREQNGGGSVVGSSASTLPPAKKPAPAIMLVEKGEEE
tara:strand:+ start:45 stop:923 length:879 start_codon:yes stop_codon:yes gene_type:complete